MKKILSFLDKKDRLKTVFLIILLLGNAILDTLGVASIMPFLALLSNPELVETNYYLRQFYSLIGDYFVLSKEDFLIVLGFLSFILIVFSALYRIFSQYQINFFTQLQAHRVTLRIFEIFLRQPYEFFLKSHSGDISKSILSEVNDMIGLVFQPILNMFSQLIAGIFLIVFILYVDPVLTLVVTLFILLLYLVFFMLLKKKLELLGNTMVAANKSRFIHIKEVFDGIKEIKLLGREKVYLDNYMKPSREYSVIQASHQTLTQIPNFFIEAIIFGLMVLITIFLVRYSGGLSSQSLGEILPIIGLYAFAAYKLKPSIQTVFSGLISLRYGKNTIDNVYANINRVKDLIQIDNYSPNAISVKEKIEIRDLSYTYPNSSLASLNNINLKINVGKKIGIIGKSGSGKTTLINVFTGLLKPSNGFISFDDKTLSSDLITLWQRNIGYVPQEIFLSYTSIEENIALGFSKSEINSNRVRFCAEKAKIHNFIKSLPSGYETLIGGEGLRLSGGQRQRIGIARALYSDPEILIFDESTNALDQETEKEIIESIDSIKEGKTILIITHKPSIAKGCDEIIRIRNGEIVKD